MIGAEIVGSWDSRAPIRTEWLKCNYPHMMLSQVSISMTVVDSIMGLP